MQKNFFFIFICYQMWIGSEMSFFLLPVFPLVANKFEIQGTLMGIILFIYSFAQLLSSSFLLFIDFSKIKFKLFFGCTFLILLGNLLFTFLDEASYEAVIICAILGRFIQGFAEGVSLAVGFSFISEVFAENLNKYIAISEIFNSMIFIVSPSFSGFLSHFAGYQASYIIISILFLPSIPLLLYFSKIFSDLIAPKNKEEEQQSRIKKIEIKEYAIQTFLLFKEPEILFVMVNFTITTMSIYLADPGIYDHVKDLINDNTLYFGFLLSTSWCGLALAFFLFSYFLTNVNRKKMMIVGGILIIISLLLIGPESFTSLPKKIWIIFIAYFLIGVSDFFGYISVFPELMDIIRRLNIKEETEIHDRASTLLSFGLSLATILGNLLGGIYINYFGFSRAMTFHALCVFVELIIFYWKKK